MMTAVIIGILTFYVGWKLGRKYQDFQDIMLARRVAKLTEQREKVTKEMEEFQRWEKQDARLRKLMEDRKLIEEGE